MSAPTTIALSILSSCSFGSSMPFPSKNFTPEYSGGVCEAVTEKPILHPSSLAPNAVTGVGTSPNMTGRLPADEMPAATTRANRAELLRPSHPIPYDPLPNAKADVRASLYTCSEGWQRITSPLSDLESQYVP